MVVCTELYRVDVALGIVRDHLELRAVGHREQHEARGIRAFSRVTVVTARDARLHVQSAGVLVEHVNVQRLAMRPDRDGAPRGCIHVLNRWPHADEDNAVGLVGRSAAPGLEVCVNELIGDVARVLDRNRNFPGKQIDAAHVELVRVALVELNENHVRVTLARHKTPRLDVAALEKREVAHEGVLDAIAGFVEPNSATCRW